MTEGESTPKPRREWHWNLLFLIPVVATLGVPWFNRTSPEINGIPFFYWYQVLWILLSAGITAVVYFGTRR